MKPFNLEAALAGAPVVTRGNQQVTELVLLKTLESEYRVVGVVGGDMYEFTEQGAFHTGREGRLDLFMAPVKRRKWLVYNTTTDTFCTPQRFDTEQGAVQFLRSHTESGCYNGDHTRVVVSFEWEE